MANERNIYKEAVDEIRKQLNREDTDSVECCLHITNIIADVKLFEAGHGDKMVYLKKEGR